MQSRCRYGLYTRALAVAVGALVFGGSTIGTGVLPAEATASARVAAFAGESAEQPITNETELQAAVAQAASGAILHVQAEGGALDFAKPIVVDGKSLTLNLIDTDLVFRPNPQVKSDWYAVRLTNNGQISCTGTGALTAPADAEKPHVVYLVDLVPGYQTPVQLMYGVNPGDAAYATDVITPQTLGTSTVPGIVTIPVGLSPSVDETGASKHILSINGQASGRQVIYVVINVRAAVPQVPGYTPGPVPGSTTGPGAGTNGPEWPAGSWPGTGTYPSGPGTTYPGDNWYGNNPYLDPDYWDQIENIYGGGGSGGGYPWSEGGYPGWNDDDDDDDYPVRPSQTPNYKPQPSNNPTPSYNPNPAPTPSQNSPKPNPTPTNSAPAPIPSNPIPSSQPTPTLTPTTTTYASCAEVEDAGKAPLLKGQAGYDVSLDPNGNGIACEANEITATSTLTPVVALGETPEAQLAEVGTTDVTAVLDSLADTGAGLDVVENEFIGGADAMTAQPASFHTSAFPSAHPRTAPPATGLAAAMENPKTIAATVAFALATATAAAWAIKSKLEEEADEFDNENEDELENEDEASPTDESEVDDEVAVEEEIPVAA